MVTLKFIGQYTGPHEHQTKTFDVVQFEDGSLGVYKYSPVASTQFEIVKRNSFNQSSFDTLLGDPENGYSVEGFLHIWRATPVKKPSFQVEKYYLDIYNLSIEMERRNNLRIEYLKEKFEAFFAKALKDLSYSDVRSH